MNNQDNNQLGALNGVRPVMGNEVPVGQGNTDSNNVVVNNDDANNVMSGVKPITPINLNDNVNDGAQSGQQLNSGIISVTPESVIPQSGNVSSNGNVGDSNSMASSSLKLESSSPFDIGFNAGVNTNVNASVNTGVVNDVSVGGQSNGNVTPITPVDLNTTINNAVSGNMVNDNVDVNRSAVMEESNSDNIVSVGKYMLYMILFSIPLVGFIVLLIKVFDKKNINISNMAKAQLLMSVIVMVLVFLIFVVLFGTAFSGVAVMS